MIQDETLGLIASCIAAQQSEGIMVHPIWHVHAPHRTAGGSVLLTITCNRVAVSARL